MSAHTTFWFSFIAVYLIVFCIDFYVTSHRKKEISVGAALRWTALWISIALFTAVRFIFFIRRIPAGRADATR